MAVRVWISRRRSWITAACCTLAAVAVPHAKALTGANAYFLKDALLWFYPALVYLRSQFARGELPQWAPELGLGAPLLADPGFAVLYPLHALLLLPSPYCVTLFLWTHVALAGAGAFAWLARARLSPLACAFGAICFSLGGYVTSMLASGTHLLGFAWLPLVLTCVDRFIARPSSARFAVAAVAWTMQLSAGEPQAVVLTGLLAGTWIAFGTTRDENEIWRTKLLVLSRETGCLLVVALAATALAAVEIVPFALLLARHKRGDGMALSETQHWSLHPAHIIDFSFPNAFGDLNRHGSFFAYALDDEHGPVNRWPWMTSAYVGVTSMALAFVARAAKTVRLRKTARFLAAATLVSIVLALGRHTPIFELWFNVVPGARAVRYPTKYFMVGAFTIPCLAAIGLDALRVNARGARTHLVFASVAALSLAILVVAIAPWVASSVLELRASDLAMATAKMRAATWVGIAPLFAVLALAFLNASSRIRRAARFSNMLAIVTIVIADVAWRNAGALSLCPAETYTQRPSWLLDVNGHAPRVTFTLGDVDLAGPASPLARVSAAEKMVEAAIPNAALLFGASQVNLYTALMTQDERAFWQVADQNPRGFLAAYGVNYVVRPTSDRSDLGDSAELAREIPESGVEVLRLRNVLPRVYYSGIGIAASSIASALAKLDDPRVVRGAAVVLQSDATSGEEGRLDACVEEAFTANEVRGACNSQSPGYFVVSQSHDIGFSASVDGASVPILTANGRGMAVHIASGKHTVRLTYTTPGLAQGLRASLAATVILASAVAFGRRRRHARSST
jgi:hypothetical protein